MESLASFYYLREDLNSSAQVTPYSSTDVRAVALATFYVLDFDQKTSEAFFVRLKLP